MDDNINLEEFQKSINVKFNDLTLLKRSLIHRSYLNETKEDELKHNERLEFLGDAVLELIVTEYLFQNFPNRTEGELTSFRSATVRTESLAETASVLNMGKYLYMSKGEESTGGRSRPYILANTFESVLGAIYLDQGTDIANIFVMTFLIPKIAEIVEKRLDIDSKSKLQEISQETVGYTPTYELLSEEGPDHNKTFIMGVKIDKYLFGEGSGKNKQDAEQKAANQALHNWEKLSTQHFKK